MKNNNKTSFFNIDISQSEMKKRSIRGGAFTVMAQIVQLIVRIVAIAALSRLLRPEDFGLVAMVAALIGFIEIFKDGGLAMATVQRPEISQAQISTLFWVNALIGLILAIITISIAPVVAWFYGDQQLVTITFFLSVPLFLTGLTVQHKALLQRQMKFESIAGIQIISQIIAVSVAIILAITGFGFWSLVAQAITLSGCLLLLSWLACRWYPGLPKRGTGIKNMVLFGRNITGATVMNHFARNLDNILIGRYVGSDSLGLYTRSYSLLMLPIIQINGPVTSVAIPALSALQNNPVAFRRYYIRALSLVAFFGFPLVSWLFVTADEIVLIVLGNQWTDSIPIFRMLCPAALAGVTNFAVGWVLIPLNQTDRLIRFNIFSGIFLSSCILVGMYWGLMGVAAAISISHICLKVPHLYYGYKFSPIKIIDFFSAVIFPLSASILSTCLTLLLFKILLPLYGIGILFRLIVLTISIMVFYLLIFQINLYGRRVFNKNFNDVLILSQKI